MELGVEVIRKGGKTVVRLTEAGIRKLGEWIRWLRGHLKELRGHGAKLSVAIQKWLRNLERWWKELRRHPKLMEWRERLRRGGAEAEPVFESPGGVRIPLREEPSPRRPTPYAFAKKKGSGTGRGGKRDPPKASPKFDTHHLLPREFKEDFQRAGLDIEEFTMPLSKERHRLKKGPGIHTNAGGNWNREWREFFRELEVKKKPITAEAILRKLREMVEKFGLKKDLPQPIKEKLYGTKE